MCLWGEGSLAPQGVSLVRKGAFMGPFNEGELEWERWVDVIPPHARLFWWSQFPSMLQMLQALTGDDIMTNLRLVMLGIRTKAHPKRWWWRTLVAFPRKKVPIGSSHYPP